MTAPERTSGFATAFGLDVLGAMGADAAAVGAVAVTRNAQIAKAAESGARAATTACADAAPDSRL